MEVSVFKYTGEDTGRKISLADSIFNIEPNDHAIYLDVKQFLANKRQGTHKAKERNEVSGTTKKLKKQKGTGTARMGSMKSPVFVGGGRVFGPQPRDYSFKLNKKLKELARKSAFTYKVKDNSISVLEDFTFEAPKTKDYAKLLQSFKLGDKKTLLILSDSNKNVYLSGRNLPNAKVVTTDQLSTYELLKADNVLVCEGAISKIENLFN